MNTDLSNVINKHRNVVQWTNLRSAAQNAPQTTVQPIANQTPTRVSTQEINNTDVWQLLNSESEQKRNFSIQKWLDNIIKRHDVRLRMAQWSISSGDKNTDKLEDARSALADYARLAYIEEAKKDKSMDLSVIESMKDQDIIDWMTADDPKAQQAYINFVNNWWFVSDVYKEMMGIDEELEAQQKREESWWLNNFLGSGVHTIKNQIAWLSDLTGLTDWSNQKEQERLQPYLNVSTDEYNRYKNWEISFDELRKKWVSWVYMDYENDVENWEFRGSIEDYWKAMYNKWMDYATQTAQEQTLLDDLDQFEYNPEWSWAGVWKFAAEMAEFMALPTGKLNWLKSTLLSTAEIMWLDILEKWELPTLEEWAMDATVTAWITWAIEWILRIPWGVKWMKNLIWWTTPEVKEALWKTTRKQWKEATNTASKWLRATKKKASEYVDKAAQWISKRLKGIGSKLEQSREKLANITKEKFGYKDLFDSINDSFKTFEEKWWGKNAAPEIKIDKAGNMSIYNEDALSSVTDSEWIKILDYIKNEWNAFRNQWRNENAQSVEKLMQDIKWKIDKAIEDKKIDGKSEAVMKIKEWINSAYEKLYKAADDFNRWLWNDFKQQRKQFNRTKEYEKFFNKYIGAIKNWKSWDKLMWDLRELEKETWWGGKSMQKWEDILWQFFKILRKDKVIKEDIGSQLTSLIYAFSIKDPKQLQELVNTIYPSVPWIEELWLNVIRRNVRASQAKSFLKKEWQNVKNEAKSTWEWIADELKQWIKSWIKKSPRAWFNAGQVELSDY